MQRLRSRASVPAVGFVSFADVQLDPLDGTVGVHRLTGTSHLMSAQRDELTCPPSCALSPPARHSALFPWGKVRKTTAKSHLQDQQMRKTPAQGHHQEKCCSEMRSKEEGDAVELCTGMPTICSAIRRAMRVGVRTVGTSTN